ncbi:hypothetical protein CXG81DRAFT_11647 [Caulochytrium protostelioides]|uniref:Core domain-containing protein n=1 Tax=Caulochytrium protostelioides TaxID=1555241 RepID=A0A4P9X8V8_9FUNG|nr:hypothetical protein CXG81DRAFT_11647 [Caulochytrium protostelioides]|eukprot:RKP01702.1 hypothetical protein CXG81DRAFT_11647 [Caulochytrium protostelioides]
MSALSPRDEAIPRKPAASAKSAASLETTQGKLLRVGTRKKGCSGNTYTLEFVDKPSRFDEQVHQDGVTILIDSRALLSLIGSEMDYLEDPLSSQFVFHNPNVKEMCGCGQSFMT